MPDDPDTIVAMGCISYKVRLYPYALLLLLLLPGQRWPPASGQLTVSCCCRLVEQEGDFDGARNRFNEALNALGYQADLAYNTALCFYKQKQYGPALKKIAEIIERGVREHPGESIRDST